MLLPFLFPNPFPCQESVRTVDPPRARHHRDDGQALPFIALLVAVVAGLALLTAAAGGVLMDRAQAKQAADAAALAGAVEGEAAARRVAAANGAELVAFRPIDGRTVEVRVRVGDAEATSRAEPVTSTVQDPSG